jgi:hypothetical protein
MIYQTQGATINTNNTFSYGDIISYNSLGLYKFAYVISVSGNTLAISCGTMQACTLTGKTHIIKVRVI